MIFEQNLVILAIISDLVDDKLRGKHNVKFHKIECSNNSGISYHFDTIGGSRLPESRSY